MARRAQPQLGRSAGKGCVSQAPHRRNVERTGALAMPNRLARETSPYLQQHADNPVEWFPWGDEALRLAREQDKPILLSVGYSACHWCHVMAHESFEDAQTAALMNALFVNIKVEIGRASCRAR